MEVRFGRQSREMERIKQEVNYSTISIVSSVLEEIFLVFF
jgi:hypothetical protein